MYTRTIADSPVELLLPGSTGCAPDRYSDVGDLVLAATLRAEDHAERAGADPLERSTCWTHRRWLYQCVSSPLHVIQVTGHRWCRDCACPVDIAVDELTWSVRLTCSRCGRTPDSPASRQIVRVCRAGMAARRGR